MPSPFDIDGRIGVAVFDEPAMRAVVNANAEALASHGATAAAFLGRASRIHSEELSRGAFSLRFEDLSELSPRGVVHLLGQARSREAVDVEVFDCDGVEATDNGDRRLVMEVESRATNAIVLLRQ
jgi:hypothetical protein